MDLIQTRLDQILKKIRLSRAIGMNYIFWETLIDESIFHSLLRENYSIDMNYKKDYYIISW